MSTAAIVEIATGRILRVVSGCDEDIALMTGAGEASVVGAEDVTDESHYVGQAGFTPYPPRPGPWAAFDFGAGVWTDPRTQADLDGELATSRDGMVLSRRQLMIGLRLEGLITPADALAPPNVPPVAIDAMFAMLPEPQQAVARITWTNFTEARRLDPLVPMIAAVAPVAMDDAAIDAFFTAYATY